MVLVDDVERTKQLLAERAAQREIPAGASASSGDAIPFYSPRRPPTTTTEQKAASPPQNPSKRLDELDAENARLRRQLAEAGRGGGNGVAADGDNGSGAKGDAPPSLLMHNPGMSNEL